MAEKFTQGQLQPVAQKIADQAMPTAKKVTDETLRPAAQKVADNVRSHRALAMFVHTSTQQSTSASSLLTFNFICCW